MLQTRFKRIILFIAAMCVCLLFFILFCSWHNRYCMGVELIEESALDKMANCSSIDIDGLYFHDAPVAFDKTQNTVYISQPGSELKKYTQLKGEITHSDASISLYIVKNDALKHLNTSISESHPLTLVMEQDNQFRKISVIITTLPVLQLTGSFSHQNEDDRDVFTGDFTIWEGGNGSSHLYITQTSHVHWHIRGNSTSYQAKTPQKLSLKTETGANNDLNLLGLGADDDWILNSLVMDDCKIREKLFMDLWNTHASNTNYNFKMSSGAYVEVIINGEYSGLYLLQRRIDAKYLELEDEDVILKETYYLASTLKAQYELVTSTTNEESIYSFMEPIYQNTDCSAYTIENVIDVNLYLQLASAYDNFSHKNMYHILQKIDNGYSAFLLPWDTDMSFGLNWVDGFCYDGLSSDVLTRIETANLMDGNPLYMDMAKEEWALLRKTVFSESYLMQKIDTLYAEISDSGSLIRDRTLWGTQYGDADTIEQLKLFVTGRLSILDEYYGG